MQDTNPLNGFDKIPYKNFWYFGPSRAIPPSPPDFIKKTYQGKASKASDLIEGFERSLISQVNGVFASLAKQSTKVLVIQEELFPGLPRNCVAIASNDGFFFLAYTDIFALFLHFGATFIKPEQVFDLFNKPVHAGRTGGESAHQCSHRMNKQCSIGHTY